MRFMAPEIIRGEALRSTLTDLHSLAVFLFYLFVRGHPLEGASADFTHTWQTGGHVSEIERDP
jgi:eukaryotic-like serine/threonine-protein kinase